MLSIQSQNKLKSFDFSPILNKDHNYLRIERNPFIDFREESLGSLTFPKTQIEIWNYREIIERLFLDKRESFLVEKDKSLSNALNALEQDILNILRDSFELSEDYRPHEVSLSLIQGVPCTKLHADFLPLRLICTYLGPGTIFLPKESTRYPCLNEGRPNKRVLIKDSPYFQAGPFELLILKGRKFNKGEMKPCAHRSPEVVKGQKRLVLKVDFK